MTFTKEEHTVFHMRGINKHDNKTIANLMNKNIDEVKIIIKGVIHKLKKNMMPEWLIAENLHMKIDELSLYEDTVLSTEDIAPSNDEEVAKRVYELEVIVESQKHTQELLKMRVAQLEEQLDYRIYRMEERIRLYCKSNYSQECERGDN